MIEIKSLYKGYGKRQVLKDVNLEIKEGSIFGLIGINGAGKTTVLRTIAGVLKSDSGIITVDGERVSDGSAVRKKIFFLADEPHSLRTITVKGLKELYSVFYSFDEEAFSSYVKMFAIDTALSAANMSKGMKRQLFIAFALSTDAKYFLFDEAFDGLDPKARLAFKRAIIKKREEGCTFVLSSHSLRELEDIADSFALLNNCTVSDFGDVNDYIDKFVKLQIAFKDIREERDIPFPCVYFRRNGRIITVIAKGEAELLTQLLKPLEPILVDVLSADFEELFLNVATAGGYNA